MRDRKLGKLPTPERHRQSDKVKERETSAALSAASCANLCAQQSSFAVHGHCDTCHVAKRDKTQPHGLKAFQDNQYRKKTLEHRKLTIIVSHSIANHKAEPDRRHWPTQGLRPVVKYETWLRKSPRWWPHRMKAHWKAGLLTALRLRFVRCCLWLPQRRQCHVHEVNLHAPIFPELAIIPF